MMNNLVINPIKTPVDKGHYDTFFKITYANRNLSITGVVGPLKSGNAVGGCGQIDMNYEHRNPEHNDTRTYNLIKTDELIFNDGWDKDMWLQFLEYWYEWHLNSMRPNCKHQKGWGEKELTLCTYRLKREYVAIQQKAKEEAIERLKNGETVKLTEEDKHILNLPYEIKTDNKTKVNENMYVLIKTETKTSGLVYASEHPEGELCKPCPVCGYKYGTAWRFEEVPKEVIDWLFSLPPSKIKPAWV